MIGMLSPEEVEMQTDEILRLHQNRDGLVATIQHKTDGALPTTVYAVSHNEVRTMRLQPSQWDQIMEGTLPGWADPAQEVLDNPYGLSGSVRAVTGTLLAAA